MITTKGLTKRFGSFTAVNGIDLSVAEGEIFGFLGANGSGKTTTVRMLLGLVLATSGDVQVMGQQMPAAARSVLPKVGALVESPAAYAHLSGPRNLAAFASMNRAASGLGRRARRSRVADVLDQVGLGDIDSRPVRTYSLGMRQRLGLALALLHEPQLLILDEPTNGLDPEGIREIRQLIADLNRQGVTIFVSSHQLAEVDQICTSMGVMDRGRLIFNGRLDALPRTTGRQRIRTNDLDGVRRVLGDAAEIAGADIFVTTSDPATLNARLVHAGVAVAGLEPERRTLEEVVFDLVRRDKESSREATP